MALTVESSAERQFRLEQTFKEHPLGNENIWLSVIASVSSRRRDRFLRLGEAAEIIKTQSEVYQNGNIPVAEVVTAAGVADLSQDTFLRRVTFNFDYQLGAEGRMQIALAELREGKRDMVDLDDPEFLTLERYAQKQLINGTRMLLLRGELFNRTSQSSESYYQLTGRNGGGVIREAYLRSHYLKRVLPYLGENELVKPRSAFTFLDRTPLVVERSSYTSFQDPQYIGRPHHVL